MKRRVLTAAVALFITTGFASAAVASAPPDTTPPPAAAAGSTPTAETSLVGAWVLTDATDPNEPGTFLVSFSSDGVYEQADPDGAVGIGAYEMTDATHANLTFTEQFTNDDDSIGSYTVRATIELAADGLTFTADYTLSFDGAGAPEGEYGPGTVTAERMAIEKMGTPTGSLEDLANEGSVPSTSGV